MTQYKCVTIKPVITTDAYSASDQVGGVQTLTSVAGKPGGSTKLMTLTIVDRAAQSAVINVFFFRASPTMTNGDNGAFALTDAEMEKCVGHVAVAAGDYKAAADSVAACVKNIQLVMESADQVGHLYAVAMTTGTPTYAVGDLVFKYGFEN